MSVAYAFPARKQGYADPEVTDFATQVRAAMEPVVDHFNQHPEHPQIDLKSVDLYGAYLDAVPAFKKKLESAGFTKRLPSDLKLGVLSYAERRHVIESANYKRQDRAKLEKYSETGRESAARRSKIPGARMLERRTMQSEEAKLVAAKKLYEYTFKRVRNESLSLAENLVPANRNGAGLVDDWKLSFESHAQLESFFKRNLGISVPQLRKKEQAGLSDSQQIERRTQLALEKVPFGAELMKNASRFKQTEWDASQNPVIRDRPTKMQLADGYVCEDLSSGANTRYRLALPESGAKLTFSRAPSATRFDIEVEKQDGTRISSEHPAFEDTVKATFSGQLMKVMFGGAELNKLRNAGTFNELYGRMLAGVELDHKVEQWVYQDLEHAVEKRLKEAGDPVMFQGTGNSYNKGLYGINWGNEARSKVMEQVFAQAGKGNLFAHGSCGFHQEALWMFGGHIVAYQDGGKTYRYSDHGGDPLEGECKQTYMRVKPFTDTAGISETKIPGPTSSGGQARWFKRDVAALSVKFEMADASGVSQHSARVTDSSGKPIVASEHLKPATWTALDGTVQQASNDFDPLKAVSVVLTETAPKGQVLADDHGRPIFDVEGQPVTELEKLTLQAMLNGRPMTAAAVDKRRSELTAAMDADPEKHIAALEHGGALLSDDKRAKMRDALLQAVDDRLRSEVSFRVARVERWERIPMTQKGADGRDEPVQDPSGLMHTYRKVAHDNPSNDKLLDQAAVPIHCVHGQNGLNVPYEQSLLAPGVDIVGIGMPREGVDADQPMPSFRPAVTKAFPKAFAAHQPADVQREQAVVEALEGPRFRTTQPHSDMFRGEAKGRRLDGTPTDGEDPLVPREIKHAIPHENHSHQREAIYAAIQSGVGLRNHRNARGEIERKLGGVKQALDAKPMGYQRDLPGRKKTDRERLEKERLYDGILKRPSGDRPSEPTRSRETETSSSVRLRRFTAEDVAVEHKGVSPSSPSRAGQAPGKPLSREQLLHEVQQQLSSWIEGIDAMTVQAQGNARKLDMQGVLQRYFRPWPDRLGMTAELKAASGSGDVFTGFGGLAEHLHAPLSAVVTLGVGSIIGTSLLAAAGAEGLKEGIVDTRRLKQLIGPLTAYRSALAELQQELQKSSANPETRAIVDKNLSGVQARLRAASRQLTDAVIAQATSGMLATAGGVGIAEGAAALAGASTAAKGLGVAYGALVGGFGAITAAQSGIRLKELNGLAEAVDRKLGKDNALRYNLLTLVEHERGARKNEIVSRAVLTATGAASAGLEIAGLAGAVPTLGASLSLTAAGVAMGAATAAAFRPIRSRHRGLNAVGGVEPTTNLPTTFLSEPAHLNHLLSKIGNQGNMATHYQREIIEKATSTEGGGLKQFKYVFRAHRALAKVIPSADKRALANKMVSCPQAVADSSMQFMLRTTQLERHYLEQHKVPALQKEVEILLTEFDAATRRGADGTQTRDLLAQLLAAKADACRTDAARLAQLQDVEERLNGFTRHLDTEFLRDKGAKQEWQDLQVDFIVAHDLVPEALSRNKLKRVHKQLSALAEGKSEVPGNPLRDALRKNIDVRFARVFSQAYPDKIAYERRGAIEVARAMFMDELEKNQSPAA